MNPDLFFETFEVTEYTERFHAVLGRALILATRFERNVRALATILELRSDPSVLDYDEILDGVLQKIEKMSLGRHIEELFGDDSDVHAMLKAGKDARNYLAHDTAVGLDRQLDSWPQEAMVNVLLDVHEHASAIATSDQIVCLLSSKLTHDQMPRSAVSDSYAQTVAKWVCDTDDQGVLI